MRRENVKIVRIEAAPGAAVRKVPDMRGKLVFGFDAFYVLFDGRKLPTTVRATLKRDAVAKLAALPTEHRNMRAVFHDGEFVLTSTMLGVGREDPGVPDLEVEEDGDPRACPLTATCKLAPGHFGACAATK